MAKNIMPDIAKLLGVEINEEFELRVARQSLIKCSGMFSITKNNIVARKNNGDVWQPLISEAIYDLFNGSLEVVRKPYVPKDNEEYWSYSGKNFNIVAYKWSNTAEEQALLKVGWIFRTEAEAERELTTISK